MVRKVRERQRDSALLLLYYLHGQCARVRVRVGVCADVSARVWAAAAFSKFNLLKLNAH